MNRKLQELIARVDAGELVPDFNLMTGLKLFFKGVRNFIIISPSAQRI